MHVLHLITSTRSFFEQQISVLEDRGIECTVIGVPGEYSADSPRTPLDYLRFYPRVLSHVLSDEYDLVHGHYGLVAPFLLAQPTRPVVLSLWGTDLMSDMGWLRRISRYGARFADATIVPSPAMSTELDAEHVEIPFGVDTELFRPIPREEARNRIGWDTDARVALFPYDRSRDVKDFPRAERVADRADVDLEVRTIDDVPYEEMPYYMNASDVLLVTSTRESGPLVVKEAAACTVPIVSTDVGFVPRDDRRRRRLHRGDDRRRTRRRPRARPRRRSSVERARRDRRARARGDGRPAPRRVSSRPRAADRDDPSSGVSHEV